MSYIRCLSNPEGFYIWSDGHMVHWWGNKMGWGNLGDKKEFLVPEKIFEGVLRRWAKAFGCGNVRYRGAVLEEIHNSKKHQKWWMGGEKGKEPKANPDAYRWRFSYKGRRAIMWRVTLEHMAGRFWCEECEKRKAKKKCLAKN